MQKRVLLMYVSEVSGHHQATIAIENALKVLDPQVSVVNINGFRYTNPISEKIITRLYLGIIKRTPSVWDYLYDNPKVVKRTHRWRLILHKLNSPKLRNLYDEFKPQVIACSQAFPCGMVADFKRLSNLEIPLVAVVTDYIVNSFWIYPTVNFYIVPDNSVKFKLIKKGVESNKIFSLGIPVDPKFKKEINKEEIYRKLGLNSSVPVILIMGGGHGIGPVKRIVKYLDRTKFDIQIIVVSGKNKRLLEDLKRRSNFYRNKLVVLGFVENIFEIMSISDILITKPGGITTAEALTKGLPMVIIRPIPGQEASNTSYLIENGAAIKVEKESQITSLIENLLSNPHMIRDMKSKALEISKPDSAFEIAKLLLSICEGQSHQL